MLRRMGGNSMNSTFSAEQFGADFLGVVPLSQPREANSVSFSAAIEAWETLLGVENVLFDDSTRANFAKTTLPTGTTPSGVLRPASTEEVQGLVEIAHRFDIPLHPVSRGKNWGYGDACAPADGQVIVDLRRMNRIREVNVELGYAIIEPGVSQGQMYEYLCDNDLPLLLDVTGAGPDASIVGNILQRGFGHTPYGDRFRHTSGFEVVLADGRLIRTGFGQFENAQAANVFPTGLGPCIDGLFTQSSLGIVTSACVWLMPKPEVIEGFALKLEDDSRLGELIDQLRELRMRGVVRSTVHVANDLRVLSSRMSYPWERSNGVTPLPNEIRKDLRRETGIGAWNLIGGLYGSEAEVRAQRKIVRKQLGKVAPVRFFRRRTIERAGRLANLINRTGAGKQLQGLVESVSSAFDLLEGIPNPEHLNGVEWRTRESKAGNEPIDVRNHGLIWKSPVVPMTGEHVSRVLANVQPIFEKHGYDFLITLTAITERAMCCVMSVNYDKTDELKRNSASAAATSYIIRWNKADTTDIEALQLRIKNSGCVTSTQPLLQSSSEYERALCVTASCTHHSGGTSKASPHQY